MNYSGMAHRNYPDIHQVSVNKQWLDIKEYLADKAEKAGVSS